uniref:cyclin-dependent kinase inhibitor 3 n=1 Tax=Erigeron canadensis TaxID=72917 RepID=UPI001CB94419|nr:cyclin-dependent kinase inhibitor 3 [Erigeron canadensis]
MGKYMRKSKLSNDVVAVMDVSQSTLGVRTRAKTLALQKLQNSVNGAGDSSVPDHKHEMAYMQLRSRKLEKPPVASFRQQNGNSRLVVCSGGSCSVNSGSGHEKDRILNDTQIKVEEFGTLEASCGENNADFESRERSTRESTPCSFIRDSNAISTPGSSTRPAIQNDSNQIIQNSIQRIMPSAQEIEEFFVHHALEQQRRFSEKYNFDIVNENPLQGRYEWVRVQP